MSSTAHASELEFQTSMLRTLEERTSALRLARDDAREALRRAQFTLDTLDADVGNAEARIDGLRASIHELRARLNPRIMASFPAEILRMVFTCLAADTAASWSWDTTHAWDETEVDVRTPYRTAAVCRRWRREAVNTSILWSFIVVDRLDSRTQEHVATMVKRSGTASVDVFLDWSHYMSSHSVGATILDSLASAARRWRRFLVMMPGWTTDVTNMCSALFRLPTPWLEELIVSSDFGDPPLADDDQVVHYLPHCPRLKELQLSRVSFLCTHLYQPISSLVVLDLEAGVPALHVWRILQHTPGLEVLRVTLTGDPEDSDPPTGRLVFPALRHLSCRTYAPGVFNAWSAKLDLPRLKALNLSHLAFGRIDDLVLRTRETVTTFQYSDESGFVLCAVDAMIYGHLHNVTNVLLVDTWIDDDFFRYLIAHSTWPKMHTITFTKVYGWDSETADALVNFVRSRTVCLSDVEVPCRLLRVVFNERGDAPDWLVEQVNFFVNRPAV